MTILLAILAFSASAATPSDRARSLERQLLAPCCFKEPVAQHQSEAALRVRREIGRLVARGRSDREILDSFRAEYGDRVLSHFAPTPGWAVLVPWVLLLVGMAGLAFLLRRMVRAGGAATQT
jgi:cytochrome c-type biogenesis protein CcmH/NrfF